MNRVSSNPGQAGFETHADPAASDTLDDRVSNHRAPAPALQTAAPAPIVSLDKQQLTPGRIGEILRQGTRAVELSGDWRIKLIWDACVGNTGSSRPFWENGILEFAKHHHKGNTNAGDMLRFLPGSFGHIARKMVVYPADDGQRMWTLPEKYSTEGSSEEIDQDILRHAWEVTSDILVSMLPADQKLANYGVTLQLLKYPDSVNDLQRMFDLFADSSGGWMAFGQQLDKYRSECCEKLDVRLLRDVYAFGSLVPGVRQALVGINRYLSRHDRFKQPEGGFTIGKPHVDGTRLFTCLGGDRDRITTEVHDGESWHKLDMKDDSLYVFPAGVMSEELGIVPTLHRYFVDDDRSEAVNPPPNVTLVLGVLTAPYLDKLKAA